jgi:hypothetical protein
MYVDLLSNTKTKNHIMYLSKKKLRSIVEKEVKKFLSEEYEYPDAGKNAPEEVRQAIERFKNMDPDERSTNILLYWLLGSGTPPYKMSKEDSQYVDEASGEQKCLNCEYLYKEVATGDHICSQIRGKVKPEGWCNQWHEVEDE